jgi:hypothetical protein
VEAGDDALTLERLLLCKSLSDLAENRHFTVGPFNSVSASIGEFNVCNIEVQSRHISYLRLYQSSGSSTDLIIGLLLPPSYGEEEIITILILESGKRGCEKKV